MTVDAQRRSNLTAAKIECEEFSRRDVSSEDDFVLPRGVSDVLQRQIVLIRPEERDRGVGLSSSKHRLSRGNTLILGILVMLDPESFLKRWMPPIRDIPGGVNVRYVCPGKLVHHHTVVHRHTRTHEPVDLRLNADADNRYIAFDRRAGGGHNPLDPAIALERADSLVKAKIHSVVSMNVGVDAAHHVAETPLKGDR